MRPSMMFELEHMPLTSHGKIDRRAVNALELPVRLKPELLQLSPGQLQLWKIWTQVLPSEAIDAVVPSSETDFMDVGGNSMLLVMLQGRLREHVGLSVPLLELFEATTLGRMADSIAGTKGSDTSTWSTKAEAALDIASIQDFVTSMSEISVLPPSSNGYQVAITGASGFAGRNILHQLLERDVVAHVHCLAVRQPADTLPSIHVVSHSDKVTLHQGDMETYQFGMTDAAFVQLARSVDVIIHCGAGRSFWDSYTTLKSVNVEPTKQLVRLAALRQVPILFMSSASVATMPHDSSVLETAPGYNVSKLVSELVLDNAHDQFGINTTTFRMASEEQTSTQRDFEAVQELMRVEKKLGKRIDFDELSGSISLAPVADLAKAIVEEALTSVSTQSRSNKHIEYRATCAMSGESYQRYAEASGLATSEEWNQMPRQDAITFMKEAKLGGFSLIATAQNYKTGGMSSTR